MRPWITILAGSALLGALSGCSTRVPARDASPLQTDRLSYRLRHDEGGGWDSYSAILVVAYTNRRDTPVYLPRCALGAPARPMYLFVREAPDTARVFTSLLWACNGGVPREELAPGATRRDTVRMVAVATPRMRPAFQRRWVTGLMRVEYQVYASASNRHNDPLPEQERRSNVFRVHD